MNPTSRRRMIIVSALSGVLVFGAAGFAAAATGSGRQRIQIEDTVTTVERSTTTDGSTTTDVTTTVPTTEAPTTEAPTTAVDNTTGSSTDNSIDDDDDEATENSLDDEDDDDDEDERGPQRPRPRRVRRRRGSQRPRWWRRRRRLISRNRGGRNSRPSTSIRNGAQRAFGPAVVVFRSGCGLVSPGERRRRRARSRGTRRAIPARCSSRRARSGRPARRWVRR